MSASGARSASLVWDPLGRLFQVTGGGAVTQLLYDGDALVGEYDGSNGLLRRYVHGAGVDVPQMWYEGSAVTSPRFLVADHQGSVALVFDSNFAQVAINSYDAYGLPGVGNVGRFQYAGQAWLPELGLYHYKARIYSPSLGRFMQTDPIGYQDGLNIYAYVGNDPVNGRDPSGMAGCGSRIEGVNNCSGMSGVAYEAAQAGKAALEAGNKAVEKAGDALSNAGDALRRLPGNVGRQISGTSGCAARMDCSEDVRVGRWMSQEEADAMIETGLVQRPRDGTDQSYVTSPANADDFRRQAPE